MEQSQSRDKAINLHDKPITSIEQDYFNINSQVVQKIINFIDDMNLTPASISVTGEWGGGKTSTLNLLVNKLNQNNKNIIILFEPLLEGKLSLSEILELFYLKLYQKIDNPKIKEIIIKCFKGLLTLLRTKLSANVALPGNMATATFEYNLEKNIDDLFKLFDQNGPKPFAIQTQELNKLLKENSYKLFIIMDEIDRLPSTHIITLLMFSRIIETFDNVVSVIAMDYKQVINKIIKEKSLGMADYDTAKSYLDKLFQANFAIEINSNKKIKYAVEMLRKIDKDNIFYNILESNEYQERLKFEKIIFHLSTLRRIKKWIITIKINYCIIKECPNKLDFIAYLSTATVHNMLIENISKHTMLLLCSPYIKAFYLQELYNINFINAENSKNFDEEILLTSAGINVNSNDEKINKFLQCITEYPINEGIAKDFAREFLTNTPIHFLILYIEGYADDKKVSAYNDFFDKDINKVLHILLSQDDNKDVLAFDLSETIKKNFLDVKGKASLDLLNQLWLQEINESRILGNSYEWIILCALKNISLDEIIKQCSLSLSEAYIHHVLLAHGIKNYNGYDLDKYKVPSDLDLNKYYLKSIFTKQQIREILEKWVENVEKNLSSIKNEWYTQNLLISVFYRYIQWSKILNLDNRDKLASFIIQFLNSDTVSKQKKDKLKGILLSGQEKFEKNYQESNQNEFLFNNNKKLITLIK